MINIRTRSSETGITKRIIQLTIGITASAVVLFLCAGRLDWLWGWVYFAMWMLAIAGMGVIVERHNPGLIASRAKPPQNAKPWDLKVIRGYKIFTWAVVVVGGLDGGRFGWSEMPLWTHLIGIVLGIVGFALSTWAMCVNQFAAPLVAIQTDKAHYTVQTGPYQYIRHPINASNLFLWPAAALVLGSIWAFIPAGLAAMMFVIRTSLEDRTLQQELAGYQEYAEKVRYRLVPYLW